MSTKFLSPGWRMPRNANQSKSSNYSLLDEFSGGIDLGTTMNITGNLSISGWFKPRGTTANNSVLVGKHFSTSVSPYFIFIARINSSGGVEWRIGTDTANPQKYYSVNSTTIVRDSNNYEGNWFHFTGTWDGVNIKIYINGALEGTTAAYGNLDATTGLHTSIAALYLSAGSPLSSLNGASNNVSFFDYALSSSQVTTLWGGGTSASNPMALPRTPVAYYPLGGSAGAFQTPANNNDKWLTENNAIGDYVFYFDGSNAQSINCGNDNSLQATSALTLSAWIKYTTNDSNFRYVLTRRDFNDNNYMFYLNNTTGTKTLKFASNGVATSSGSVTLDKWHHVAVTANGNSISFYIDGQPAGTSTITALNSFADKDFVIGDVPYSTSYEFAGLISNAQMFNTVLSATEVSTLYNYGSPIRTLANIPQNSNLKAWYKLDASEIYDSSNTQWQIANNVISSKAYSFNGTNNIEITQNSSIQTSNFSIGLWIKGYPQLDKTIIENGGANGFSIKTKHDEADKVLLRTGGVDGLALTGALNGEWNFVYFTMSGNASRGGINGGYSNAGGAARNYDSSKGLFIGSKSDSTSGFTGEIAQVVYYSERGPNNANGLYGNLPANPPPNPLVGEANPSLVSWWKLDAASITDSNGSNNGTNNGATLIDTNVGRPAGIGGLSSGMIQSNLVQSDLQTVAPYSKYAMNFDGTDYIEGTGSVITGNNARTVSCWMKSTSATLQTLFSLGAITGSTSTSKFAVVTRGNFADEIRVYTLGTTAILTYSGVNLYDDNWHNVVVTYSAQSYALYIDGIAQGTTNTGQDLVTESGFSMGRWYNANWTNGSLSNVSVWNAALTASQVREIYNEGLPSNLNSHSAYSNLVSWWQLGENSSYVSGWTFEDEIGSNNGASGNLPETALTNGVGTTANGTSSGMGVEALVGDAPYSTANAISSGMAATARGPDIPPTP